MEVTNCKRSEQISEKYLKFFSGSIKFSNFDQILTYEWEGLVDQIFLRRHLKTGVLGVLDRRASPRNLTSRRILYDVGGVMGGITRR